jgi:hypothetical protein
MYEAAQMKPIFVVWLVECIFRRSETGLWIIIRNVRHDAPTDL